VKSFVVVLVVLVVLVLVAMSDDTAMNIPHDGDDEDEDEEFEFLLNSVRCGANLESVKARFMQSKAKKETWFDSSRSPSLLHAACSRGDAQVVQYILEEAKKYFSTTGVAQKEKNKKNNAKKKTTTTTTSFGGVFSAPRLRVRPFGDAPMFISRAQLDVRSNAFEVREGALLEEEERELVASTDQFSRAHSNRELIDNDGSPGREGLS